MAINDQGLCPSLKTLTHFLQGEVDEPTLVQISEHLEFCQRCLGDLQQIKVDSSISQATTRRSADTLSESDRRKISLQFWKSVTPEQIGKYPIKAELAVGGMGVVYEAWHPSLMCEVVIKTIKPERTMRLGARKRMLEEQQTMGRIRHPSIVAVLDADIDGDLPFLVMEKVPGVTLAEWIADQPSPCERRSGRRRMTQRRMTQRRMPRHGIGWRDACRICRAIAEGLAILHQSGLIHRDVKPSNVMIDENQRIKLLDLGLAIDVGETGTTVARESAGTPNYVSPEQARGGEIDFRTDLYGLGATLTFLLSGSPPSEQSLETITRDGTGERLPAALRSLLSQLLDQDPRRRPNSVADVSARLAKICGRSSWAPATLAIVIFAMTAAMLAAVIVRPTILGPTIPETATPGTAEHDGVSATATATATTTTDSKLAGVTRIFERPALRSSGPLPSGSAAKLDTFRPRPLIVNAKLSRSERYLACFGVGGNLRIYDVSTPDLTLVQLVRCYESTNVNHPQINWMDQDRVIAVTGAANDPVLFWDFEHQAFRSESEPFNDALASHVNAAGDRLVVCDHGGKIVVYDAQGTVQREWSLPDNLNPTTVAWSESPPGLWVATDAKTLVHYSDGLAKQRRIDRSTVITILLSLPSGQWCLGDRQGNVHHVDKEFKTIRPYRIDDHPIRSMVIGERPTQIVVAGSHVQRLDLLTGQRAVVPDNRIAKSPVLLQRATTGTLLAGGNVRQISLNAPKQTTTLLKGVDRTITAVDVNSARNQIAFGTSVGVTVADTEGTIVFEDHCKQPGIQELQWSPSGNSLAAVSGWGGRYLYLWSRDRANVDHLTLRHVIDAPNSVVTLAWLDERSVVTAGEAGIAHLWDIATGTNAARHDVGDFVRSLAVSPDGKRIALGFQHAGIRVVNRSFEDLDIQNLRRDGATIRAIRWHPTANQLAVLDEQRHVKVMDVESGTELAEFYSRWSKPTSLCWTAAGDELAVTPLGIFGIRSPGQLVRLRELPHSKCVDWSTGDSIMAIGDALSSIHFYRADQHRWTIVLDQIDSAITLDPVGNILSRWGTASDLIR